MTPAPTDADFDDMHHALGRPAGPHVEPYRNFYSCEAGGATARRFAALGLWERGRDINAGRDAVFRVTPEGRHLLMSWLVERQRKAGLRPWIVSGRHLSTRTIMAKSASAARYAVFLEISDVFPDGFREFLRFGVNARAA